MAALYAPPSHRPFWLRTARIWDGLGSRLAGRIVAGVLVVEVAKQVFIMPRSGNKASVLGPLDVLGGIAKPEPAPQRSAAPLRGAEELAKAPAIEDPPGGRKPQHAWD